MPHNQFPPTTCDEAWGNRALLLHLLCVGRCRHQAYKCQVEVQNPVRVWDGLADAVSRPLVAASSIV